MTKASKNDGQMENKLRNELAALEHQYIQTVKRNPTSANATRKHLVNVDKIVSRMKYLRNTKTINRPVRNNDFLRELLYPNRKQGKL